MYSDMYLNVFGLSPEYPLTLESVLSVRVVGWRGWARILLIKQTNKNDPIGENRLATRLGKAGQDKADRTRQDTCGDERAQDCKHKGCIQNRALFEGTAILSSVRVHSFNLTMHRKNECTTDVHSTARESP